MLTFKQSALVTALFSASLALTACGGGSSSDNNPVVNPTNPTTPTESTTPTNPVQIASLSGKVINKTTNMPVMGATVTVDDKLATTDKDGNYSISNLTVGSKTITVSAKDFTTQSFNQNLVNNLNSANFVLTPLTIQVPTVNRNLFGKELATGYAGTYTLNCKNNDATLPDAIKTIVIDNNGKVMVGQETLFENQKTGSFLLKAASDPSIDGNADGIFLNNNNNANVIQVGIAANKAILFSKNEKENYICDISLKNPTYFTDNAVNIIKTRLDKVFNVECRDGILNPTTFKSTVSMLSDNSIKVGDTTYAGTNFRSPNFVFAGLGGIANGKNGYQFNLRDNINDPAGKGMMLFFDENENFASLYIDQAGMNQPRTCGVIN